MSSTLDQALLGVQPTGAPAKASSDDGSTSMMVKAASSLHLPPLDTTAANLLQQQQSLLGVNDLVARKEQLMLSASKAALNIPAADEQPPQQQQQQAAVKVKESSVEDLPRDVGDYQHRHHHHHQADEFPKSKTTAAKGGDGGGYDPLNFPRIISVLTSAHSQYQVDRHLLLIDRLMKHYSEHSLFGSMRNVCEVLLACQDRLLNGEDELAAAFTELLQLVCTAFDQPEAYDSANIEETTMLLNTLGDMLEPNLPHLMQTIMDLVFAKMAVTKTNEDQTAQDYAAGQIIPTKVRQLKPASRETEQAALFLKLNELSSFMMAVVEVLPDVDDLDQQVNLLVFLARISARKVCAAQLAERGAVDCLCAYLSGSRVDRAISNGIESLWNILYEGGLARVSAAPSVGEMNFHHLLILWQRLISKARNTSEKQLRNDLTCIMTITVREDRELARLFHHLQGTQLVHRAFRDCGGLNPRSFRGDTTSIREDAEFLKFLLGIMHTLSQEEDSFQALLNEGVVESFNQYLAYPAEAAAFQLWNPGLTFNFQSQVIDLWMSWLPCVAELSRNVGVAGTLTKLLQATLDKRPKLSFQYQTAWNTVSQSILRMVLVLAEIGPDHKNDFGSALIQPVIFRFVESPHLKAEVLSAALLACASLAHGHKRNRQLFGTYGGSKSILPHVKYTSPDQDEYDKVVVAAADCIWESVAGNKANEDAFLEHNGVFMLLEALETTQSKKIQKHLLGCLLDLLENPKTRAHVLEWRSDAKNARTVASVLIALWNAEEKALGVESNGPFELVRIETNPLAGKSRTAKHPRDTLVESQAVKELVDNLRAKIFSIFYKLGFDVFDPYLSTKELIKLKLIQKYLDFKIGEVWVEMEKELEYECVRPTTPDAQIIRVSQEMCLKKAQDVEARQLDIAKRQQQHDEEEERKLYALFIESHRKYEYREPKRDLRKLRISTAFEDGTQVIKVVENP